MKTFIKSLVAVAVLALSVGTAQAAASYCAPGATNDDGLSTSDMTYNGADANDCYGVGAGNDSLAVINGLDWGNDWANLVKSDGDTNGTFLDWNFTLSDVSDADTSGIWTLTGGPLALLPTTLDFVAVLKSSTFYAAYLFDDIAFTGNDAGTWTIQFLNASGKNIGDLSHLSLYVREGDDGGGTPNVVPEPGMLALLGLGILGMAALRRRKSA